MITTPVPMVHIVPTDKDITLEHNEELRDEAKETPDANNSGVVLSAFAHLSTKQTILKFRRNFFIGVLTGCGAMYIGFTGSAIGNIIANAGFVRQFGTVHTADGIALNAQHVSIWGAVQQCGQIFFQLISPFFIDRFGRKFAMFGMTILIIIAVVLEITVKDWRGFAGAKLLVGCACGWLGPGVMTYMSEIAMPQYRGVILTSYSLSMAIGGFSNSIACQIVNTTAHYNYRRIFYSEFAIVSIWSAVVLYLPESPLWLISKGRDEKAKASLRKLVGIVEGYDMEHEFACLKTEVLAAEELNRSYAKNDWKALVKKPNVKRIFAASLPFALQQFAGVPYVFFYTTYFFQIAGFHDPFEASVIINVMQIVAMIIALYVVERIGRRPLVVWGLLACAIVNSLIGILGFVHGGESQKGAALVALVSLWIVAFGVSLSPIGWISIVEIASTPLRAKTAAIAVLINSLQGLAFTYITPLLLSSQYAGWGVKVGLFYGGMSFACLPATWYLYPESKQRTFAELDELYERGISPRKFHLTTTTYQSQVKAAAEQQHSSGI